MKFTCSSQVLSRGITAVRNAVGSPISNPIVENIHVSCEADKVRFHATNLNLTIRCEGEAQVMEAGEIVLPSKIIVEMFTDLPSGEAAFETQEETARIQCGEFKARMKGQSGELFPPFVGLDEGEEIRIEAGTLKNIIRKTIISSSSDKSRFELDGVKCELKGKEVVWVATDGRRLSFYSMEMAGLPEREISALIPTKTLQEVQRILPDEGEISVLLQERKVQFKAGDTTIISNLLKDNFPQYQKIIPPEGQYVLRAKRAELAAAVKRASYLSNIETKMIILKMSPAEVEVLGEREEVGGEGRDMIAAEFDGEKVEMRFNYDYLQEGLRVLDEESVELRIIESRKPGVIRGAGNSNFLYVIMPIRPPDEEE